MLRTVEDARLLLALSKRRGTRSRRKAAGYRLKRPRPTSSSKRARPSHILMSAFVACPPIECRHARQRIAKKPSRQIARLKLGAAIAIRQRQRTRPRSEERRVGKECRTRRER